MSHRAWWLVISAVVLLCIAVAVQDGLRLGQERAAREAAAVDTAMSTATAPPPSQASLGNADVQRARDTAMMEAVSTLHTYVAALFKTDSSEADALWTSGHPAAQGETGLRALTGVTGVRIDNSRPEQLDTLEVPAQLRIPVRLRVGAQGPLRRFEGHYDLQRDADGWRIRAASIAPSPVRG